MRPELIALEPAQLGPEEATLLALTQAEAGLLASGHPFLEHGDWRAFAAVQRGGSVARVVASVDARQVAGGKLVGCIGFVHLDQSEAPDARRGAGDLVLSAALGWLLERQVGEIRGPIQLSTWYGHRTVTDAFPEESGAPPFLLEPRGGRAVGDLLVASGFTPAHRAVSFAVDPTSVIVDARSAVVRLRRAGLVDRAVRMARIDEELRIIHRISLDVFRDSWGFSPISFPEFATLYRPLASLADPELVRILETADGSAVGFGFALPDEPSRPGTGRYIVKSLGLVAAARQEHPGVGVALTGLLHSAARDRGYVGGIHALMAEGSMAHRLSMRWGHPVRSYATFARSVR